MPELTAADVYRGALIRATTLNELEAIRVGFEAAYQQRQFSYEDYMSIFALYSARLKEFGGGGGGGGGGAGGAGAPLPAGVGLEESPIAAYLRGLKLPVYGMLPGQEWQAKQFLPTYGTYTARGALAPPPAKGTTAPTFLDYLGTQTPYGARLEAPGLFRQAAGLGTTEQVGFEQTLGKYFADFMRSVLRQAYAYPVAEAMGERIPMMKHAWEAEGGGAPTESFLSYLQRKFGLGAYG